MRKYSKYPLKLVNINIIHDDCWTSSLNNVSIKSIGISYYSDKNILRGFMLADMKTYRLLNSLRDKGKLDILNIYRQKNKILVDIKQPFLNSVFYVLLNSGATVLEVNDSDGEEKWKLLAYEYNIPMISKELNKIGKITDIKINDYNLELHELSDIQSEITKMLEGQTTIDFRSEKTRNIFQDPNINYKMLKKYLTYIQKEKSKTH